MSDNETLQPTGEVREAVRLADTLAREKRIDEALAGLDRSLDAATDAPARRSLFDARARIAADASRFEAAAQSYRSSLALDPRNDAAQLGLADAMVRLGDRNGAIQSLQAALPSVADTARVHQRLGGLLRDAGQLPAAEAAYRAGLDRAPTSAGMLADYAELLRRMDRPDEAATMAVRARDAQPGNAGLNARMGAVLLEANRFDEATVAYRQAVAGNPAEAGWRAAYATSLVGLGQVGDAAGVLRDGLAREPSEPRLVAKYATVTRERDGAAASKAFLRERLREDTTHHVLTADIIAELLLHPDLIAEIWPQTTVRGRHVSELPSDDLVPRLRAAFGAAIQGESELDPAVLDIRGMSGRCYRRFINNLIRLLPNARYLEVGSWAGSTLCSVVSRNVVRAVAIDNWSQFGGPKAEFQANLDRFRGAQADVTFLERDFRAVDYATLGKFNVYLFDGPHGVADQRDGISLVRDALDRRVVLVVDDWNWSPVRQGTFEGIQAIGYRVLYSIEVRTTFYNDHPRAHGKDSDWHNGYILSVAERLD